MPKPINVGIIGCGTHAFRGHYQAMRRVGGMKLVALYDPNPAITRPRDFTKDRAPGVKLYRREDEFFAAKDVKAVIICSPDRFHAEQLHRAVCEGKHALVDKPAAATLLDHWYLQRALKRADRDRIVVSSCHPRRFNPAYVQMKTMLPEWIVRFGKPLDLMLDFSYHEPRPSRAGLHTGLLADHLGHETDFMRFLFGRSLTSFRKLVDSVDRYAVAGIRRDDDIAFTFSGTRRLKGRTYPETVRIRFERGEVTLSTKSGSIIETDHETSVVVLGSGSPTDYEVAFDAIMRNFARAIRGKEQPYLSHDDILNNSCPSVNLTEHNEVCLTC